MFGAKRTKAIVQPYMSRVIYLWKACYKGYLPKVKLSLRATHKSHLLYFGKRTNGTMFSIPCILKIALTISRNHPLLNLDKGKSYRGESNSTMLGIPGALPKRYKQPHKANSTS